MSVVKRTSHTPSRNKDLFARFGCDRISFELSFSPDTFDIEALYKDAEIYGADRKRWSSVCASKNPTTDYHIHFRGSVTSKRIHFRMEYVSGSLKPGPDETEPYAESFFAWLGGFAKMDSCQATVHAGFMNSHERWRSRFNLPFKVMMTGLDIEVAIDGIFMQLPKDPKGAKKGWLTRYPDDLWAAVLLEHRLPLKRFNLQDELQSAYSAVLMFVEEIKK